MPFSETSISACSVPLRTSSASSLWSAARAIAVWQMVMTCRKSDLSLTMRTYSSTLSWCGRPSVSEKR